MLIAAATTFFALTGVALFNVVVDPLGMFRLIEVAGFNQRKPAEYTRVRLAKAYEVRRIEPKAIILGTSRSHLGLRPSHDGWDRSAAPRYNLAFDGATTKEMYYFLRHAHSVAPVRQIVLGIDTYQLSDAPATTRPGFDPEVLYPDGGPWSRLRMALSDLRMLIGLDTFRFSVETLRAQSSTEPEWLAQDGQRLGEVFFRRPGEMFLDESPRAYFEAYDRQEVGYQAGGHQPAGPTPPYARSAPTAQATSFEYVRQIVEYCRENGIDLRIYTTPTHARNMEIAVATGAWPAIEAGKRRLVALLEEDSARHPGKQPFPFFDFADYSSITTEPLPPLGSKAEMRNYWDSSHFKESVGDLVLDRLFGITAPGRGIPEDFGVRIDSSNIEDHLRAVRARQAAYRTAHDEDVLAIARMVQKEIGAGSG